MMDPMDSVLPADAEAAVCFMLMQLLKPLVSNPEHCCLQVVQRDGLATFVVCVTSEDMRTFTGPNARTGKSLRIIVSAVGAKSQRKFALIFQDSIATAKIKNTLLPEITKT